ncbi:MAG TPA: 4-(cytidine 5'-diphospho)-2-C-methyl-D-erythritol kinase [Alphaproteobacteria bacterium]|nr:4-(cytidine 5'-diphospho)-2-C-methyl-D-erythritol kinase [Alphaproteobacteria bacterium]
MSGTALTAIAPAKLNLSLSVTGRNRAGYHLLDSIVGFTRFGDRLTLLPSREISLAVTGPFAASAGEFEDNLVWHAARALAPLRADPACGVRLVLEKHIPVAAGLGGGSSDAALALRLLRQFWTLDITADRLQQIGLGLGADVPVCLLGKTARMRGIGDKLMPVPAPLAGHQVLLVNPGIHLPTAAVFGSYRRFSGQRHRIATSADMRSLQQAGNSLTASAVKQVPEIADLLGFLQRSDGASLVRMSGSGATCFALYERHADAMRNARLIAKRYDYWCKVTQFG